jgi:starvation-inducible DNA-binding protein
MYPTKNDLSEQMRSQLVELLNARLADGIDLMLQAKQAHWNVKGPNFYPLHELFDKLEEDTREYVDLIAERAAQLGGIVEGTIRLAAKRSSLDEYPLQIIEGRDHLDALSTAIAKLGKAVRQAISQSDELGDAGTTDIFTEASRGLDKLLWFVESHLRAKS